MTTKPQVTTTAWHRATQHCALEGTSHSTWHFEQSPSKLYWQYTPWNYHIPYQPALFESMMFPNFPLGGRYVFCRSRKELSTWGKWPYFTNLENPKTKRPYIFLPDVGRLPGFRPPKIIPYKARPWLNHNESLGEFSRLKIPQKKSAIFSWKTTDTSFWDKKHPRPCCRGEIFGIWWLFRVKSTRNTSFFRDKFSSSWSLRKENRFCQIFDLFILEGSRISWWPKRKNYMELLEHQLVAVPLDTLHSNTNWAMKKTLVVEVVWGIILPNIWGFLKANIRIPINQPVLWKVGGFFS